MRVYVSEGDPQLPTAVFTISFIHCPAIRSAVSHPDTLILFMAPVPTAAFVLKTATLSKVSDHVKSTSYSQPKSLESKMDTFPRSSTLFQPKHHLSFVALCVGFLLIWTCVISALLLSNSLTDKYMTDDAEAIFQGHQDVGKVLFALGHEMVSTVDLLLSSQDTRSEIGYSKEALQITWQMTDVILNQVISNNHMKLASHLQLPYEQWMEFRGRSINLRTDPRDAINLYLLVSRDLEKHYQKFTPSSIYYSSANALRTPFINSGIAYSIFNSGMFQRFAEIALGTCYVRSSLMMINYTEFLDLQFTSTALIESAFQFHPRAQARYFELRCTDSESTDEALSIVRQDMLSGGRNRNDSQLANTYLEAVKNEIAQLLLTKDYLNTTVAGQIKFVSQQTRSTFFFYLSVTIIALVAVLSCLILLCCSLKSLSLRKSPPRERIVYKANTFQQRQNELRSRSQTLPIETIFNPFNIGISVDRPVNQSTNISTSQSSTLNLNNNDNKPRCFF